MQKYEISPLEVHVLKNETILSQECWIVDIPLLIATFENHYETSPCTNFGEHYGLKLTVLKFSNFPLLNPSQIAPKFYSLVEQCRAKNSTWVEADSI